MKHQFLSKTSTILLSLVIVALSSCSFTYSVYRDADGKAQKTKTIRPKPESRLSY